MLRKVVFTNTTRSMAVSSY